MPSNTDIHSQIKSILTGSNYRLLELAVLYKKLENLLAAASYNDYTYNVHRALYDVLKIENELISLIRLYFGRDFFNIVSIEEYLYLNFNTLSPDIEELLYKLMKSSSVNESEKIKLEIYDRNFNDNTFTDSITAQNINLTDTGDESEEPLEWINEEDNEDVG